MKKLFGPKNRKESEVYAIEGLLAETQYCIESVMNRKNVSRSELARRLDCSPANVTQMLSEYSNLRLESVARIFHVLGDTCIVRSRYLESRKESTVAAAKEDKYALGSVRVAGGPCRRARRLGAQGGEQALSGALVWDKVPSNLGVRGGLDIVNPDEPGSGAQLATANEDNYASAA